MLFVFPQKLVPFKASMCHGQGFLFVLQLRIVQLLMVFLER